MMNRSIFPAAGRNRGRSRLALTALVLLISFSFVLAGCGKNVTGGPKYTAAQIARDLLVGEQAFLKTAEANHGAECRSGCTLETIKDAKLCVKLCNWIKGADIARDFLAAALNAHCGGPGYLQGTAPCAAGADNGPQLVERTQKFREAMADLRAADQDGHD